MVAFLAAALALAACTRTAFRDSLLMPASKATNEMLPCERPLEDDGFGLVMLVVGLALVALRVPILSLPFLPWLGGWVDCGVI